MSHREDSVSHWTGTVFIAGLGIGIAVGIALGSIVAIRLGSETVDTVRSLIDRMSGRGDQVHFELLLQ
jgi:hypothetical protein